MQNIHRRWQALWHPERFHGWGRSRSYFEGWYFKLVTADEQQALAIIPGIAYDQAGKGHAFIQWMDGTAGTAYYHEFPPAAFRPSPSGFRLQLGEHVFASDGLQVQLPGLQADIRLLDPSPWPRRLLSPGIMGWYSFVPFMECYHGLISMDHRLEGTLMVDGQALPVTGGRGYLEKDWGTSFPSCWVWMQTNHFHPADTPTSLFASVARIPWMGRYFVGFIVAFLWRGRLYNFATYRGSQMRGRLEGDTVHLAFRSRRYQLELTARPGRGAALHSPVAGKMTGKVNESLQGTVGVQLRERSGPVLFSGTGVHAGLEVAGDTAILWTPDWRS